MKIFKSITGVCFAILTLANCAQEPREFAGCASTGSCVTPPLYSEILEEVIKDILISEDKQQLFLGDEMIASFDGYEEIVSSAGSFQKGRTLNFLKIDDIDFLVYGEDGAFAAECEPHPSYSSHGYSHPKCKVLGSENFDTWIVCAQRNPNTDIQLAQEWTGFPEAMTSNNGMKCWKDGIEQLSDRFYTY